MDTVKTNGESDIGSSANRTAFTPQVAVPQSGQGKGATQMLNAALSFVSTRIFHEDPSIEREPSAELPPGSNVVFPTF
jgi:hypothetical protein